ncbi:hypothetical protein EW146_g6998 [Bondarzewia mesenterica]|uniref:Protein-S-isoprenylcysteine O-methyltransferase n=1 Tax=Bondarzewia mesenterica TaxID=1095465 RepID=A0A4S4LM09_9AGAM|nr:hypothetical protein EW146_g6998 [Bondarzewia mesenterica]
MSLQKLPILLAVAPILGKAYTPPVSPKRDEKVKPSGLERFFGQWAEQFTAFFKITHAVSCLIEASLILAHHAPHYALSQQILSIFSQPDSRGVSRINITPSFLLGSALALGSSQLRFACYRIMGRLFTFQLSLRSGHRLITDGPYAFVRHPAYTGLIMLMMSEAMIQWGQGSWLRECGWLNTVLGKTYFVLSVGTMILASVVVVRRTVTEDKFMKDRFGDEWMQWAKKTPKRLIPGIF